MSELISIIIPALLSMITGVAGWFVGRRKRDNDLLQEQVNTVRLLMESNQKIMTEYTKSQEEKMKLREEIGILKWENKAKDAEIASLIKENKELRQRLAELQAKLDHLIATGRLK